jgi:hypothetical protein
LFDSAPRVLATFPPEVCESNEALLRGIGFEVLEYAHQRALHGSGKATLLWTAERINTQVQPKIRLK